MTEDYTEFIPFCSDQEMKLFQEDMYSEEELQPSESVMRNILQYAAGIFVFRDQDEQSQFLIMN